VAAWPVTDTAAVPAHLHGCQVMMPGARWAGSAAPPSAGRWSPHRSNASDSPNHGTFLALGGWAPSWWCAAPPWVLRAGAILFARREAW